VGGLLWTVVVVLFVLWALGFFVANVGSLIHVLLVLAVIAILFNLFASSRSRAL
jgi:uncharacterized membrane protein YoaK (UPF0700 family)